MAEREKERGRESFVDIDLMPSLIFYFHVPGNPIIRIVPR